MSKGTKEYLVAKAILEKVGGKENIKSAEHCATRLRLILKDKEKFDAKAIEGIDGVKGQFFSSGQHQIILGTGFVNKVYGEIQGLGVETGNVKQEAYKEMSLPQKISRTFGDIFLPIIPVLVATGLFMGIRGAILSMGYHMNPTLLSLSEVLTDTAFVFLPALVAWTTMKRFGGTPVIGLVLGLMLVSPSLPNAWNAVAGSVHPLQLHLFGFTLDIVGYQGSVLPALALGMFAAYLEKNLRKVVPNVLDLILTPFLTLLISLSLGLIIIGPAMQFIQDYLLLAFEYFLKMPFGIGGLVIGSIYQLIVVTGLHQIFNALEVGLLSKYGADPFNAIITGTIIAQGAAGLAVAFKTRDKKKKALYTSFVIPAFFGITEPVIFGLNLRLMKPFLCGLAGGAAAGWFASFIHLAADGMGVTVLPGTLLYINHNLMGYIITNAIGFGVAFGLTMVFYKDKDGLDNNDVLEEAAGHVPTSNEAETVVEVEAVKEIIEKDFEEVFSPVIGELIDIASVDDKTFADKLLGDGAAVKPKDSIIYAPADGEISALLDTKHAVAITTGAGVELLIHVGVDTVAMKGEGFKSFVEQGQRVKAGDKLLEVDFDLVRKNAPDDTVFLIVTNGYDYKDVSVERSGAVTKTNRVIEVDIRK